jgi:hypothetical protein
MEGGFTAVLVELLVALEGISAIAHDLASLGDIA